MLRVLNRSPAGGCPPFFSKYCLTSLAPLPCQSNNGSSLVRLTRRGGGGEEGWGQWYDVIKTGLHILISFSQPPPPPPPTNRQFHGPAGQCPCRTESLLLFLISVSSCCLHKFETHGNIIYVVSVAITRYMLFLYHITGAIETVACMTQVHCMKFKSLIGYCNFYLNPLLLNHGNSRGEGSYKGGIRNFFSNFHGGVGVIRKFVELAVIAHS